MTVNVDVYNLVLVWQIVFVIAALIQLAFFILVYGRIAFHKPIVGDAKLQPVSVVIAARNEYENLRENLPIILEQDYPEFEVIVVNDSSYDDSEGLLHALKSTHKRLHVVNIKENDRFDGGKKLAVTLGIKAARHERILLTDADCRPTGYGWIRAMVAATRQEEDIVLGYSPFTKVPGLLNALIRFDGVHTAQQYFGFALAGNPYMGVGRNLSYPKAQFFKVGGFRAHYSLRSGDDDLLINQIARKDNTTVCLNAEAMVETEPEKTWKNFWRQKRRHLTTGWRYRPIHKLLLAAHPLSLLLLFISSIALVAYGVWIYAVAAVILLRMVAQIVIFVRSARWLGQKDLAFFAPLLEILTLAFAASAHIANASSKQSRWKT